MATPAYNKRYRERILADPERAAKHKADSRTYSAAWRARNRDHLATKARERRKQKRAENPELVRQREREYRARRPDLYRESARRHYLENKPAVRARRRKSKGLPEPTRLCPAVCECCGRPPGKKALALDHCHATGEFRGWLCLRCNSAIGLLGDTEEAILNALHYIRLKEKTMLAAAELLSVLVALINAGANGIAAAQRVSAVIEQRRKEGAQFTREDLDQAVAQDDEARAALEKAIREAGG